MIRLIAVDMDGTLLRSDKTMSLFSEEAIRKAAGSGAGVVFCTGRSWSELLPFFPRLPEMRYAVCQSGAFLYDLTEDRCLFRRSLPEEVVAEVVRIGEDEDVILQVMSGKHNVIPGPLLPRFPEYHMEPYLPLYRSTGTLVRSTVDFLKEHPKEADKINIWHLSQEARERTIARLRPFRAEKANAEAANYELTPEGTDKGSGLAALCKILNIRKEEVCAIGDNENDLPMFREASLKIAMGNAVPSVKAAADRICEDNDSDGCAKAILSLLS